MRTSFLLFGLFYSVCSFGQPVSYSWKTLYDSTQLVWGRDWAKSVSYLSSAEKIALSDLGLYDENYLSIINDLGLAYWKSHNYSMAEKYLQQTIQLREEMDMRGTSDHIHSLINLASLYAETGNSNQAIDYYQKVLEVADRNNFAGETKSCLRNILSLCEVTKDFQKGFQLIERYSEGVGPLRAETQLFKARFLRLTKKFDEATGVLIALADELRGDREMSVRILQEQGLLNLETGLYNGAEKYLLQALRIIGDNSDPKVHIELLNNLGNVYEKLGIYDKAEIYYTTSRTMCISEFGEGSLAESIVLNNIAGVYLRVGRFDEAIARYESLLNTLRLLVPESDQLYITTLNNLGAAYRSTGDFASGYKHLTTAKALISKYNLDQDDVAAVVMNNLAVLHAVQNDYLAALPFYQKAFTVRKNIFGDESPVLRELCNNMAVSYWATGDSENAIRFFKKANSLSRKHVRYIFPGLNENEQVQFYRQLKEDFERFMTIVVQHHTNDADLLKEMFRNQLLIKSLHFLTQQRRAAMIAEKKDSTLLLQQELLKLKRQQLGHLYQLPIEELEDRKTSIKELEQEIDKLEKVLTVSTGEAVVNDMVSGTFVWDDIRKILKSDEALVDIMRFRKYDHLLNISTGRREFGFTDSVYYAALVSVGRFESPSIVLLRNGVDLEKRLLSYYKNSIAFSQPDLHSYKFFWKPFEPFIEKCSRIYISADGIYHQINTATMLDDDGKYVMEKYDLIHVVNASEVLERRDESHSRRTALLIGNPDFNLGQATASRPGHAREISRLPGTAREIQTINALMLEGGWQTAVRLERDATESAMRSALTPSVLHIATHGFFSEGIVRVNAAAKRDFLFHSGLMFSGANNTINGMSSPIDEDGILTAYDVMNMDLSSTDLVVLSACETGLGKIENGEGVHGLQRSFLQAGARQVMISLWKVDDTATTKLMTSFYKYYLEGGRSARECLKQAQLDMMKAGWTPNHWGAFVIVGMQ
jgi:CHAT domain-containing protein/tetratricopeptide (TPR) repeat protein